MRKALLTILLFAPLLTLWSQTGEMNLDSLYMNYMSDSSKTRIQQLRGKMKHIEQQEQESEEHQLWWHLLLAGCALSAVVVTGGIFSEVFKGHEGAPLVNKLKAGAICLCGGLVIFLLDVGWFYMSFEATQKAQKLILFAILLVLGIALWIYTKNLNNE